MKEHDKDMWSKTIVRLRGWCGYIALFVGNRTASAQKSQSDKWLKGIVWGYSTYYGGVATALVSVSGGDSQKVVTQKCCLRTANLSRL